MIERNGDMGLVGAVQGLGNQTYTNGPKKWEECTTEQKLERLRHEIDGWRNLYGTLIRRIMALEGHQHGHNGELLVSLHASQLGEKMAAQAYDMLR